MLLIIIPGPDVWYHVGCDSRALRLFVSIDGNQSCLLKVREGLLFDNSNNKIIKVISQHDTVPEARFNRSDICVRVWLPILPNYK